MSRILVGVSGSIAAYKTCDLVSGLVQAGHTVDVVLSRGAERFITPLSFSALTHRPVLTNDTWWADDGAAAHLRISEEAERFVIAPCTADLIGKFAHGIADEILSTTYLGCTAPVLIAPAMNTRMWAHPRVRANVDILRADGVQLIGPGTGYLAEGDSGTGRMSEPAEILEVIARTYTD